MSDQSTETLAASLARPSYAEIQLYSPNREPARIDLSDNTNLWGVPPAAGRAVHEAATSTTTRYPSLYADELKRALAAYLGDGVSPDMIVTGCGSDDVLDATIRAFTEPGDAIAYPEPSFAMIPIFARVNELRSCPVPLTDDMDTDAEGLLATGAKVIYLCSPNNPTGTMTSHGVIERVVNEAPGIVIIDEAYAEFAPANALDLAIRSERVLVSRTMSKAFGLAGLRVGYGVGAPALAAEVEKSRGPYKVSSIAERAALAALTEDLQWVSEHVAEAKENRERLADSLREMGLAPLPSGANFLLVPVPVDAIALDCALRERGIAVRPFTKLLGIGDALRISVGPWSMLEELLAALSDALGGRGR